MRERADLTRKTLGTAYDSNFTAKAAQTLTDLADYVSRLGLDDPRLMALKLANAGQDAWVPGEHAGAVLASAGFNAEGVEPDVLLSEIVARSIEDLTQAHSDARAELAGGVNRAHAAALDEAAEEKGKLIQERDEARADLEAEREARRKSDKELAHLKQIVLALDPDNLEPKPKKRRVKRIPDAEAKPAEKAAA
ncbi:MAG: hypothetical protein ACRDLL_01365 [Solirubrobacterales bacterium]